MQIIDDFKTIKELTDNKKVGWMIFEEKRDVKYLHQGHLDGLDILNKNNDIVVVDLLYFGMLLSALWRNERYIPKPFIKLSDYEKYFQGRVDYLFFQIPEQQLNRIMDPNSDIGIIKKPIIQNPYPYQYEANELITKSFNAIFLMYKKLYNLNISESANMWKCGFRSFFYRDSLKQMGIKLHVMDPPIDKDGLIPMDHDSYCNVEVRNELIKINNEIKSSNFQNVDEVYIFDHPEYAERKIVEAFIKINGLKNRLVQVIKK